MRIGVDASCWTNKRGYGRYTRELLRRLLAIDRRNEYWLFLDAETARRCEDLPDGTRRVIVETSRAAAEAASAEGHRRLRDLWAMGRAVRRHHRELDLFYFPSVYTFFPLGGPTRVAVTIHDTIAERHPDLIFPNWRSQLLWRLKVHWAVWQADLVLTVSEASRRNIVRLFGLQSETVRVVADAVSEAFHPLQDARRAREVLAAHGVARDARIILYVGGLSPHKNLRTLIEAYARLLRTGLAAGVTLVLVGDFKGDVFYSNYPALRRLVTDLGVADRVVFTGFVADPDLVYFYNAAEALVLPSFDEGFGLPAVEAMACGTPVVASRIDALTEVVGEAGLFFDPLASGELADRLQDLLGDPGLRAKLGQTGLARARRYSWDRSAQAAREAFESVGRRRESAPA